jgi:hypothetical protein
VRKGKIGRSLEEGTLELLAEVRQAVYGNKASCTYPVEEEDMFDPFLASVENLADIFMLVREDVFIPDILRVFASVLGCEMRLRC